MEKLIIGMIQYTPELAKMVGVMTAKASCAGPGWYTSTVRPNVQISDTMIVNSSRSAMITEPKLTPTAASTIAATMAISVGTSAYSSSITSSEVV
jgi:hypothetical protein